MTKLIKLRAAVTALLLSVVTAACHSVDDTRIPPMPVYIAFTTVGEWNVYGVSGALSWRRFIKSDRVPNGYPYTEMSATGFGGVMLVSDYDGAYRAYDLACPVERKRDVRITVDTDMYVGRCPVCGSTYDIFRMGGPLSGPAADHAYGLTRYSVAYTPSSTPYMLIRQ